MIVGVDVSSRRVDLAWLENGRPCRWHQELAKGHLIDRLRSIQVRWPNAPRETPANIARAGWNIPRGLFDVPGGDITDIVIEYPFGRGNAVAALMATVGVITKQAPPWARVAWPSSGELRTAIGAKNTKTDAHERLDQIALKRGWDMTPIIGAGREYWDEHSADALIAALGWGVILDDQDAA